MAGDHVCGYVKIVLHTWSQNIQSKMYRLHVWPYDVDERLGHVGISTHTAGKSDLPRNLIVSQICDVTFALCIV